MILSSIGLPLPALLPGIAPPLPATGHRVLPATAPAGPGTRGPYRDARQGIAPLSPRDQPDASTDRLSGSIPLAADDPSARRDLPAGPPPAFRITMLDKLRDEARQFPPEPSDQRKDRDAPRRSDAPIARPPDPAQRAAAAFEQTRRLGGPAQERRLETTR